MQAGLLAGSKAEFANFGAPSHGRLLLSTTSPPTVKAPALLSSCGGLRPARVVLPYRAGTFASRESRSRGVTGRGVTERRVWHPERGCRVARDRPGPGWLRWPAAGAD